MKYDYAVYIGRFQPFHKGHLKSLEIALEAADKVIILVGSVNKAPDIRNPWSYVQRVEMIKAVLRSERFPLDRVTIEPLNDIPYNDNAWIAQVQSKVNAKVFADRCENARVAIVGFARDHTSF